MPPLFLYLYGKSAVRWTWNQPDVEDIFVPKALFPEKSLTSCIATIKKPVITDFFSRRDKI